MNVSLILDRRFELELFWTTVYERTQQTYRKAVPFRREDCSRLVAYYWSRDQFSAAKLTLSSIELITTRNPSLNEKKNREFAMISII